MLNTALIVPSREELNEFTAALVAEIQSSRTKSVLVKTKSGDWVDVCYNYDEIDGHLFHSPDWDRSWFANGQSCSTPALNLMEISL